MMDGDVLKLKYDDCGDPICCEDNCPLICIAFAFLRHLDVTIHFGGNLTRVMKEHEMTTETTRTLWQDVEDSCLFKIYEKGGICRMLKVCHGW